MPPGPPHCARLVAGREDADFCNAVENAFRRILHQIRHAESGAAVAAVDGAVQAEQRLVLDNGVEVSIGFHKAAWAEGAAKHHDFADEVFGACGSGTGGPECCSDCGGESEVFEHDGPLNWFECAELSVRERSCGNCLV